MLRQTSKQVLTGPHLPHSILLAQVLWLDVRTCWCLHYYFVCLFVCVCIFSHLKHLKRNCLMARNCRGPSQPRKFMTSCWKRTRWMSKQYNVQIDLYTCTSLIQQLYSKMNVLCNNNEEEVVVDCQSNGSCYPVSFLLTWFRSIASSQWQLMGEEAAWTELKYIYTGIVRANVYWQSRTTPSLLYLDIVEIGLLEYMSYELT